METDTPIDIYTQAEFKRVASNNLVKQDIVIRSEEVKSLAPIEEVKGSLGICDCLIETLSPLKYVHGDIWFSFYYKKPCLKSLGSLKRVEGNASFRYLPLEDLGDLEYVGGNLSLRDTNINSLGNLIHIGGNLNLPMRLKEILDLSHLNIGGNIRYWNEGKPHYSLINNNSEVVLQKSEIPIPYWPYSYLYPDHDISSEPRPIREFFKYFKSQFDKGILLDIEGNYNYPFMLFFDLQKKSSSLNELSKQFELLYKGYPKLKGYCEAVLRDLYKEKNMIDEAWKIDKNNDYISISTIKYYCKALGYDIFDGEIASRICGISCLTQLGKSHFKEISPFFKESLKSFENEHRSVFFDVFYDDGKGYKSINGDYSADYYKQFYKLDEDSFEFYKAIGNDDYHKNIRDNILVVEHAVKEQLKMLLIQAEDLYRESIGIAKVGEGWVNETALFYKIKNHFKDNNVVQHGHPKWLGKQHLDIYIEDLNIGVEYQGIQHYKPIDYFGGEEGFARNQERDERKKRLCEENSCPLIYVKEGYIFDDVVKAIKEAMNS